MRHEVAQGHWGTGWANPRAPGVVEAFEDLRFGELRQERAERGVQVEFALFDQLQRPDTDDDLRHRAEPGDGVSGPRGVALPGSERAAVRNAVGARRERGHTGHLAALDGTGEQQIDLFGCCR